MPSAFSIFLKILSKNPPIPLLFFNGILTFGAGATFGLTSLKVAAFVVSILASAFSISLIALLIMIETLSAAFSSITF